MKLIASVSVVFTARVVFDHNDDLESPEDDQNEIRRLLHRLMVLKAAIQQVEKLRHEAAQALATSPCNPSTI
jgi:hypothetical protein